MDTARLHSQGDTSLSILLNRVTDQSYREWCNFQQVDNETMKYGYRFRSRSRRKCNALSLATYFDQKGRSIFSLLLRVCSTQHNGLTLLSNSFFKANQFRKKQSPGFHNFHNLISGTFQDISDLLTPICQELIHNFLSFDFFTCTHCPRWFDKIYLLPLHVA